MKKALLVIDVQNDYFAGGKFPLWNTEQSLTNILSAIKICQQKDYPIILIQHVADPDIGLAPFFNKDTHGVEILPQILAQVPNAMIVEKSYADGFVKTTLNQTLEQLNVDELLVCGYMTQNCVTHTAISNKKSRDYKVSILQDACSTVSEPIHLIALNAASTWLPLISYQDI